MDENVIICLLRWFCLPEINFKHCIPEFGGLWTLSNSAIQHLIPNLFKHLNTSENVAFILVWHQGKRCFVVQKDMDKGDKLNICHMAFGLQVFAVCVWVWVVNYSPRSSKINAGACYTQQHPSVSGFYWFKLAPTTTPRTVDRERKQHSIFQPPVVEVADKTATVLQGGVGAWLYRWWLAAQKQFPPLWYRHAPALPPPLERSNLFGLLGACLSVCVDRN